MFMVSCSGCLLLAGAGPVFTLLVSQGVTVELCRQYPGSLADDGCTRRQRWVVVPWRKYRGAIMPPGNTRTPTKFSAVVYSFFVPLKIAAFFRYGMMAWP